MSYPPTMKTWLRKRAGVARGIDIPWQQVLWIVFTHPIEFVKFIVWLFWWAIAQATINRKGR